MFFNDFGHKEFAAYLDVVPINHVADHLMNLKISSTTIVRGRELWRDRFRQSQINQRI